VKGTVSLTARSISETKQVRYLLGLSSPAEREQIAWEYFESDDAFQEMLAAENDLLDAYARGELTGEERRGFEKNFVNSARGEKRIRFARAFAGAVSNTRRIDTKLPDVFKIFQSPGLLRIATIAVVIALVAVLAWLVIDRRKMSNELGELRAESLVLSKRTETLQRSSDTERTRTAELAAQLVDLQAQPDKARPLERVTIATQRARHLPDANDHRLKPEVGDAPINTSDAVIGNTFESRRIAELPLNAQNVVGLLSLQPGTTRAGFVNGGRSDQANVTLDGVDVNELNTFHLIPRNTSGRGETTIRIPSSLSWIRFQIALETTAIHEDYRLTIKTSEGRPVTTVDWREPLTPSQTIIDTPVITTGSLRSGYYVLLLTGKAPDGSYAKVAEYSFRVFKY
jgi:hypothetical protein